MYNSTYPIKFPSNTWDYKYQDEPCIIEEAFKRLEEEYKGREWLKPNGLYISCSCRRCTPIC